MTEKAKKPKKITASSLFDRYRIPALIAIGAIRGTRIFRQYHTVFNALWESLGIELSEELFAHEKAKFRRNGIPRISQKELSSAFPVLKQISRTLGLNRHEQLLFVFFVYISNNDGFWLDLNVQIYQMSRRRTIKYLATVFQMNLRVVSKALDYRSSLFNSGLIKPIVYAGKHSLPLVTFFQPVDNFDLDTLRSKKAWREFLGSRFQCTAFESHGENFTHLKREFKMIRSCIKHAISHGQRGVHILLYGPPGTGKTTIARLVANELELDLLEVTKDIDADRRGDGVQRINKYRFGQRFGTTGTPGLMLFDEMEDISAESNSQQAHKGWLIDTLESSTIPTFWTCNSIDWIDPAILRRFLILVHVDIPPRKVRSEIIENTFGEKPLSRAWKEKLASIDRLSPANISALGRLADAYQFTGSNLASALELWIDQWLKASNLPSVNWKKQDNKLEVGCFNTSVDAEILIDQLGSQSAGRVCLYGPPGTGKTAFAKLAAKRLELPLLSKCGSSIRSAWVGQTEANIADMFQKATKEHAVLLLDEADTFLGDRGVSNQRWQLNETSEFLVQLESYEGIFIATTNRYEELDSAFLRRFDFKIMIDYLTFDQRLQLLKNLLDTTGYDQTVSEQNLAKLETLTSLTPGDFAVVERRIRFSQKLWTIDELISALEEEVSQKPKLAPNPIGYVW